MQTVQLDWAGLKTDIIAKGFPVNYKSIQNGYEVFVVDRGLILWTSNVTSAADITDFETNYKSTSNRNYEYDTDGRSIVAQKYQEVVIIDAVAIRDTNVVNSAVSECRGYRVKTLIVNNGLNQIVTLQAQASRDSTNWFNVGNPWEVAANTLTFASCEYYFPYLRMTAQCSVAPASGNLSAWCEKMGA